MCSMHDEVFCLDFASVELRMVQFCSPVTGVTIACVVEKQVQDPGLSMDQRVGQACDGAALMCSKRFRVVVITLV